MSKIWALADLHLSFGVPNKGMEVFGEQWRDHPQKIEAAWRACVAPEDLVLIAGDISWALRTPDAIPDLEWIEKLPGTKVMIRGNHDLWWGSISKTRQIAPPSIHAIQHDVFRWNGVAIGGTRLWDSDEYDFEEAIDYRENPVANVNLGEPHSKEEDNKIFHRELLRLEMSLKQFRHEDKVRLVMVHYPPISLTLYPSKVSTLLEQYHVSDCIFGHLHNVKPNQFLFGEARGVHYHLTSADYLDFKPKFIMNTL